MRIPRSVKYALSATAAILLLAGCATHTASTGFTPPTRVVQRVRGADRIGGINRVVIIMQENRTMDNLLHGLPGANTSDTGVCGGIVQPLTPTTLGAAGSLGHNLDAFTKDYDNGLMDQFSVGGPSDPQNTLNACQYVQQSDVQPYFDLAEGYAAGDHMFTSNIDASFVSHQFMVAGQSGDAVDFPTLEHGCLPSDQPQVHTLLPDRTEGPQETACWDYPTIMDSATSNPSNPSHPLTWAYYAAPTDFLNKPVWIPTEYIQHLQGTSSVPSRGVREPETTFFSDLATNGLANITFITPNLLNSDHSGGDNNGGPSWVASIVNAIGESPYWEHTIILISWDDWGGWYDHLPPPYIDTNCCGIRVPFIMVGPYVKHGYVSHQRYEQASLLKVVDDVFGFPPLTVADDRATDPLTVMNNFNAPPRAFVPINTGAHHWRIDTKRQEVDDE